MAYTLEQLSDKIELQELCWRYSHAIDSRQFDDLDSIFTADAYIDYTAMGGPEGHYPEIKQFLADTLPNFPDYYHLNANLQITLNGDSASGRVMCFNPMGVPVGEDRPHMMLLGLFYVDEYVRTDDGWRIARRIEERSWSYNTPPGLLD